MMMVSSIMNEDYDEKCGSRSIRSQINIADDDDDHDEDYEDNKNKSSNNIMHDQKLQYRLADWRPPPPWPLLQPQQPSLVADGGVVEDDELYYIEVEVVEQQVEEDKEENNDANEKDNGDDLIIIGGGNTRDTSTTRTNSHKNDKKNEKKEIVVYYVHRNVMIYNGVCPCSYNMLKIHDLTTTTITTASNNAAAYYADDGCHIIVPHQIIADVFPIFLDYMYCHYSNTNNTNMILSSLLDTKIVVPLHTLAISMGCQALQQHVEQYIINDISYNHNNTSSYYEQSRILNNQYIMNLLIQWYTEFVHLYYEEDQHEKFSDRGGGCSNNNNNDDLMMKIIFQRISNPVFWLAVVKEYFSKHYSKEEKVEVEVALRSSYLVSNNNNLDVFVQEIIKYCSHHTRMTPEIRTKLEEHYNSKHLPPVPHANDVNDVDDPQNNPNNNHNNGWEYLISEESMLYHHDNNNMYCHQQNRNSGGCASTISSILMDLACLDLNLPNDDEQNQCTTTITTRPVVVEVVAAKEGKEEGGGRGEEKVDYYHLRRASAYNINAYDDCTDNSKHDGIDGKNNNSHNASSSKSYYYDLLSSFVDDTMTDLYTRLQSLATAAINTTTTTTTADNPKKYNNSKKEKENGKENINDNDNNSSGDIILNLQEMIQQQPRMLDCKI